MLDSDLYWNTKAGDIASYFNQTEGADVSLGSISYTTTMSTTLMSATYQEPNDPTESHQFYSAEGDIWSPGSATHTGTASQSHLRGLFLDAGGLSWHDADAVTDYSPGTYSDSDHQTLFFSGLSSSSSPDDILDFEHDQYGNAEVGTQRRKQGN